MQSEQRVLREAMLLRRAARGIYQRLFPIGSWRHAFYRIMIRRPLFSLMSRFSSGQEVLQLKAEVSLAVPLQSTEIKYTVPKSAEFIRRILLIKLDHIGDFLIACPAFDLLRETFPSAEITLLCATWNRQFAERSGYFDRVVCCDVYASRSEDTPEGKLDAKAAARVLANESAFDIAIDLKVESDSRQILHLITARTKAGYESEFAPPDMSIVLPTPRHQVWETMQNEHHTSRLLYTLASAVIADFKWQASAQPTVQSFMDKSPAEIPGLPAGTQTVVGINMGAGVGVKCWPVEYFAELIDRLLARPNTVVVLFGAKAEVKDAQRVTGLVKSPKLLNLVAAVDLPRFTALISKIDLYVGNDTGTTHLAAALNVPTVCIYSGSAPFGRFLPIGTSVAVLYRSMGCAPCTVKNVSDCMHGHSCMRGIAVEVVLRECDSF